MRGAQVGPFATVRVPLPSGATTSDLVRRTSDLGHDLMSSLVNNLEFTRPDRSKLLNSRLGGPQIGSRFEPTGVSIVVLSYNVVEMRFQVHGVHPTAVLVMQLVIGRRGVGREAGLSQRCRLAYLTSARMVLQRGIRFRETRLKHAELVVYFSPFAGQLANL